MKFGRTDKIQALLDMARRDAQTANDLADSVLGENERLLDALQKERERNEMMSLCVIDTLREALGMGEEPVKKAETVTVSTPEIPKVIQAAIESTFPGDKAIYDANTAYAWSQQHRWDDYAREVAEEIKQGELV